MARVPSDPEIYWEGGDILVYYQLTNTQLASTNILTDQIIRVPTHVIYWAGGNILVFYQMTSILLACRAA